MKSEATARPYGSLLYKASCRLPINAMYAFDPTGHTNLVVQVGAKRSHMRDMRVSFNPSKFDLMDAQLLLEDHFQIPWDLLIEEAYVSEYHAAIDVDGIEIDDLLLYMPKVTVCHTFISNGMPRYLGANSSSRKFCIYDKKAEIISSNKRRHPELKEPVPLHELTRFEARLRPNIPFRELETMDNPFETMQISLPPNRGDIPLKHQFLCELLIRLVRYEGLNAVLALLPKKAERAELRGAITRAGACSWWRPKEIWTQQAGIVAHLRDEYGPRGLRR